MKEYNVLSLQVGDIIIQLAQEYNLPEPAVIDIPKSNVEPEPGTVDGQFQAYMDYQKLLLHSSSLSDDEIQKLGDS